MGNFFKKRVDTAKSVLGRWRLIRKVLSTPIASLNVQNLKSDIIKI